MDIIDCLLKKKTQKNKQTKVHLLIKTHRKRCCKYQKVLKIPNGYLETVNQRGKDNTNAKWKRKKVQTTIYKPLHKHLKIEDHNPL